MHLEISFPVENAPGKGIKLPRGYMQRKTIGSRVVFYKPLEIRDGLFEASGVLKTNAIRAFLADKLCSGMVFAIYDDDHDPFKKRTDVRIAEFDCTPLRINTAYYIT